MPNIVPPNPTHAIISDDGTMSQVFMIWTQLITDNDLIIGTGSPEGAIDAAQGRIYMDDAGIAGAIVYIKRDTDIAGDRTKGWILI